MKLSPQEELSFSKDLSEILEYFSQIDKVKLNEAEYGLEESVQVDSLREDNPVQFPSDDIMKSVPARKGQFVRGPKMS